MTFLPSSFGIFFSERLTSHSVSTGSISFIISTHMLLYDIGALMGPAVGQRLGYRRIIMTFLIIVTISFAILAFADSISGILVAYGVLLGKLLQIKPGKISLYLFLIPYPYLTSRLYESRIFIFILIHDVKEQRKS